MAQPQQKMALVSNLWVRQMHFKHAGDANEGHEHNYDHTTLLAKGRVRVTVDGKATEFAAPAIIYVQKGKLHFLEALEDDCVAYCVHALRAGELEEDLLDPSMIPEGITPWNIVATGIAKPL